MEIAIAKWLSLSEEDRARYVTATCGARKLNDLDHPATTGFKKGRTFERGLFAEKVRPVAFFLF